VQWLYLSEHSCSKKKGGRQARLNQIKLLAMTTGDPLSVKLYETVLHFVPMNIPRDTRIGIFVTSLFLQFFGALFYFVLFTDTGFVQLFYSATKVLMIVVPVALIVSKFKLPRLLFKENALMSLVYGVVSGVLMSGFILGAFFTFYDTFFTYSSNILAKVIEVGILPYYFWVAIGISVFHSLFEELFWRWYAVHGLQNFLSPLSAMLIGAGLFALHHYVLLSQFVSWELTLLFGTLVGVGGLIWSWMYKKTGSILSAWVSHAIVDATLFSIGYLLIQSITQ